MFESRELKAMAFGYALVIPLCAMAIYLGAPIIACVPLLLIGFFATLMWLNMS
jgi:hypothetical protein